MISHSHFKVMQINYIRNKKQQQSQGGTLLINIEESVPCILDLI